MWFGEKVVLVADGRDNARAGLGAVEIASPDGSRKKIAAVVLETVHRGRQRTYSFTPDEARALGVALISNAALCDTAAAAAAGPQLVVPRPNGAPEGERS